MPCKKEDFKVYPGSGSIGLRLNMCRWKLDKQDEPKSSRNGDAFHLVNKMNSVEYLLSFRKNFRASAQLFVVLLLMTLCINTSVGNRHEPSSDGSRRIPNQRSRHEEDIQRRHQKRHVFLNQFIVNLKEADDLIASELARKYGFVFKGQIGQLEGWYLFEDKKIYKRSLQTDRFHPSSYMLKRDKSVNIVDQLKVLSRQKRNRVSISFREDNGPNDPAWSRMWYMHCGGIHNDNCPTSMKISDAWRAGYFGSDVVVTILDDGIEATHPDLRLNYDANASYDINDMDNNPTPRYDRTNENKHGTRCAGVVAAVSGNHICSVGIAYRAKIGGVRMLDGEVTDSVEARSLGYNPQHIDIYSASWGPDDDGSTVEGPGYLAKAAFKEGAKKGRDGKGSIFVWASGNGGHNKDSCSCDGYINSIYTIGISSVSQNGKRPWYLESCASTLATTYSSGEGDEGKVITTDLRGMCTFSHTGTSASAPMAAGVIALMLEANENLTWRDVQHIIVRTSNPYGLQAKDWVMNGAGYNVSHVFGFGLMDAARLTHVAKNWARVPEQKTCSTPSTRLTKVIVPNRPLFISVETSSCSGRTNEINYLEHVILRISLSHTRRGDLQIFLTSPAGTRSNILEKRAQDRSNAGFDDWDFMTTHHWGENPQGLWTLEILDSPFRIRYRDHSQINELKRWQLIFHGTQENPQPNFSFNSCDAFPQDHCHPECDGCCGPTDMECRSCAHVATFTGRCIPSCPSGQFPHIHTRICQPCWKTCRECSAATDTSCTSCDSGFSLSEGRCVKMCTEGFYLDQASQLCKRCYPLCHTCEERADKCTTCRQGFEKRGFTCKPSCPSGTFLLSFRQGCQLCHQSCMECSGSTNVHCTECSDDNVLHKRRCLDSCPRRYYMETRRSNRTTCRPCHSSCKTCTGPTPNDCDSCGADFEVRDGRCMRICRDEFAGNYRSYPCLLVIQKRWCNVQIFRSFCCDTCTRYESGQLFSPLQFPEILNNLDFHAAESSSSGEYDYGDYENETEETSVPPPEDTSKSPVVSDANPTPEVVPLAVNRDEGSPAADHGGRKQSHGDHVERVGDVTDGAGPHRNLHSSRHRKKHGNDNQASEPVETVGNSES